MVAVREGFGVRLEVQVPVAVPEALVV